MLEAMDLPIVMNVNPHSIYNKQNEFHNFVIEEAIDCIFMSESWEWLEQPLKERVHSEMKISLIKKGILVTVPIRLISFRLFYFSWRKGYGKIMQVRKQ